MQKQNHPDLYMDGWTSSLLMAALQKCVKVEEEQIVNIEELAVLSSSYVLKGTKKRNQKMQGRWTARYPLIHQWQLERLGKVISHYADIDQRIDTNEYIVEWFDGPKMSEIDWTQDLTEEYSDKYNGNINFTYAPSPDTDSFTTALVRAFEPPRDWNKAAQDWWYDNEYMSTYDSIVKSDSSVQALSVESADQY